jgi:hypothetical protein
MKYLMPAILVSLLLLCMSFRQYESSKRINVSETGQVLVSYRDIPMLIHDNLPQYRDLSITTRDNSLKFRDIPILTLANSSQYSYIPILNRDYSLQYSNIPLLIRKNSTQYMDVTILDNPQEYWNNLIFCWECDSKQVNRVQEPEEAIDWLKDEAYRIIRASKRTMNDGTAAFPPQVGIGYEAFWLRDYEYTGQIA